MENNKLDQIIDKVQGNIILFLPLMLSVGILIYYGLPYEPDWFTGALALVIAVNGLHLVSRYPNYFMRFLQMVFLTLVVGSLGFLSAQIRTAYMNAPVLEEEIKSVHINGVVERIDRLDGRKGSRVLIRDVTLDDFPTEKTPAKVRIRIVKDDKLEAGQRISVKGDLLPPPPPVMPGGFDFQRWAFFSERACWRNDN